MLIFRHNGHQIITVPYDSMEFYMEGVGVSDIVISHKALSHLEGGILLDTVKMAFLTRTTRIAIMMVFLM